MRRPSVRATHRIIEISRVESPSDAIPIVHPAQLLSGMFPHRLYVASRSRRRAHAARNERCSLMSRSQRLPLTLSTKPFRLGFSGVTGRPWTPAWSAHDTMAVEVNSGPLSLTIVIGLPRSPMRTSSSRATRWPESKVSTNGRRLSRVRSSTTARTLNRRGSVSWSETKARLQARSATLGAKRAYAGVRAPVARPLERLNSRRVQSRRTIDSQRCFDKVRRRWCGVEAAPGRAILSVQWPRAIF